MRQAGWLLATALALSGCGPSWKVRTQAVPDPFVGAGTFSVEPVLFEGARLLEHSERDYLEGKDDAEKRAWKKAKTDFAEAFEKALARDAKEGAVNVARAADAPFGIRAAVVWVDPGMYVGTAARASRVRLILRLVGKDGKTLDEVEIQHGTPGSSEYATVDARIGKDGAGLGRIAAEYIRSRVKPGDKK